MIGNIKYYILLPDKATSLPTISRVKQQIEIAEIIKRKSGHLLIEEKRMLENNSINLINKLFLPKNYPFKNGQQPETRNSIVWTDFSIYTWPLLIQLLKISPAQHIDKMIELMFKNPDQNELKWDQIAKTFSDIPEDHQRIEMDELDRWYDEINITLLPATSYHQLYNWFGPEVKDIGYDAFDHFTISRNGPEAWKIAIENYLKSINNLPEGYRQELIDRYITPIINY